MLHHAYLIKGWLLDKDPPAAVTQALEAIIAANERVVISGEPSGAKMVRLAVDSESEPLLSPALTPVSRAKLDEPAKGRGWTPERRAEAAGRMRQRQANGGIRRGTKKDKSPGESSAPLPNQAAGARPTW